MKVTDKIVAKINRIDTGDVFGYDTLGLTSDEIIAGSKALSRLVAQITVSNNTPIYINDVVLTTYQDINLVSNSSKIFVLYQVLLKFMSGLLGTMILKKVLLFLYRKDFKFQKILRNN